MKHPALARALASPRALAVAALVAFALALPSLRAGLLLDDWFHRVNLEPYWQSPNGIRGSWDLYHFVTEHPAQRRFEIAHGMLPWWTTPVLRLAFLRPLASLTLAFDHLVLGRHAWAMHLENALWYAALAAAAGAVYRRAIPEARVAALAALLFAVDHTHAMLVVWLSNRHAVMSAVFALAAFAAHLRWRQDEWSPGRVLAPLLYATALACGETALCLLAYLLPYTLWNDRHPTGSRLRALAPYVVISVAWAALYRQQGCGAYGGDLYIDPVRQPLTFAAAFLARAPILSFAQVFFPPSEFVPPTGIAVGVAVAALLVALLRPLASLVRADPMARTWLAGALLSLVPACATMPNDRLLLASGLGAMGLLARALDGAWWSGAVTTRGARAVLAVLATIHLVLSPLLLVARSHQIAGVSAGYVARADASLPTGAGLHEGLVIAVTAPDPLTTPYAFSRRMAEGRPWPRRGARLLVTPSAGVTTLRREGPRSVVVTASVPMPHDKLGPLYRGLAQPFRAGERIETDGMTATVVERAEDGRARSVRFTFARDLDDPMYRWVHWVDGRFAAFPLPAVGATVTLAPIDWLKAMAGP